MKQYFVYILTNRSHSVLYIGVTNNIQRRLQQHKEKNAEGFTKRYNCDKLIYFEQTENVWSALEREEQLKKWNRRKKEWLIGRLNLEWKDLGDSL